jgi:hypothetical protein
MPLRHYIIDIDYYASHYATHWCHYFHYFPLEIFTTYYHYAIFFTDSHCHWHYAITPLRWHCHYAIIDIFHYATLRHYCRHCIDTVLLITSRHATLTLLRHAIDYYGHYHYIIITPLHYFQAITITPLFHIYFHYYWILLLNIFIIYAIIAIRLHY